MKRILWIFALVFSIALSANAQKKSSLDRIISSGELRVGMSGNQPPYSMESLAGQLIGYEVDLATALAEGMNVELKLVQKPFGELLSAMEAGEIDVVMSGMTITPERNKKALFVGPYMITGKSIMAKESNLEKLNEETEINQSDVSIVALKGSTSEDFAKLALPDAKLTLVDTYDAGVELLLNDEVGAMIADVEILQVTALRHPDKGLAVLDVPLTIEPIGIALPAGDFQFENLVTNYFSSLQMVGLLDLLEMKWFEDGSWLMQIK